MNNLMKTNKLYKRVISEVILDSREYAGSKRERILARLNDISNGLSSGIVTSMIYYTDTIKFYNKYNNEIAEMLYSYDVNLNDLEGWDRTDMLALDTNNQNILAWWVYEVVCGELWGCI